MLNIIRRKLKDQRNSVLVYAASVIAYAALMISLFPSMREMDIEAIYSQMPENFMKFFGTEMTAFSTIEGYISVEFLSLFFPLIIVFYAGSTAGSAIAGQIERRTIDFNLSQPISRTKLVLSETVVALIYLLAITSSTGIAMLGFGKAFDVAFKPDGVLAFVVTATLFMWAFYGLAILISSLLRSKMSVMLITAGVLLGSYIFSSLSRIVEKLQGYDKYSLFYLYNPEELLRSGNIQLTHLVMLLIILGIGLAGAVTIFNKKDV